MARWQTGRPAPLATLLCVFVCLVGCGRHSAAPRRPVTLRIGAALPNNQAPQGLAGLADLFTQEALVTNEVDGRHLPRLASSWSWDDSRCVLTLKLRPGLKFHDGSPLTGPVAAATLRALPMRPTVLAIKAVDDQTLEIRLSRPDAFLLPDLSVQTLVKPNTDIGTGPFKVVQRGNRIVLEAFADYYRGRPAIDRIEIERYPTQRMAWAAMMRGDVDMLHEVSRDAVEFVEAESTVHTYSFPYSYYIPLVFNVRHPVLRNATVRRALNEAIDRATLIKDGLRGRGRPALDPVWPEHWAYSALPHRLEFNPAMAQLRLDSAGYRVRAGVGPQMPSRFAFTCLLWADDSRFERLALVLQQELADIGVDMKIQPVRTSELVERVQTGDFDAYLVQMAGRSLNWLYRWHSSTDRTNVGNGYSSADDVLDRIAGAMSDDEVRSGIADLVRVFDEDPPAIFIAWQVQSRAVSTRFDVQPEPNRDIFTNVWQWRPVAPALAASR